MESTTDDRPFALPPSLAADGYALRPEADADTPFLLRLYGSTRDREMARMTQWSIAQKSVFVAQQFDAQRRHYRSKIAGCNFWVLTRRDKPIGRLYLDTRPAQLRIVDIALLPAWRDKGIGGAILAALIETGRRSGRSVGLAVDRYNDGAIALYRRLGFVAIGETETHIEMEHAAPPIADDAPTDIDGIV